MVRYCRPTNQRIGGVAVIRFRNPGSDLDTMIAVLKQLYHELHEKDFF